MMNQTMIKRYALFLCGLLINAFGIALITKAGIGTSPISSFLMFYPCHLPIFPLDSGLF